MRQIIHTDKAPQAIGTYSQAVKVKDTLYLSGQIALSADSMQMVSDEVDVQIKQVFANLSAVLEAAAMDFSHVVKLNIYLCDLSDFPTVNEIMAQYFAQPYPARAAVEVSALPKGAKVEMDAIAVA